jgi:hypothetical protein
VSAGEGRRNPSAGERGQAGREVGLGRLDYKQESSPPVLLLLLPRGGGIVPLRDCEDSPAGESPATSSSRLAAPPPPPPRGGRG